MIPQHIVYRAAQAMWEVGTSSEWRDDVWAAPHLTRARAALEAVAADIWDEGYEACADDVSICTNWNTETPNPYRNERA